MPKCSFCGKDYDIPRGLTFVLPNGNLIYFCCSKCEKNYKMGRRGDKQNWVRKQKKIKGKEVVEKEVKTEKKEVKKEKNVEKKEVKAENKVEEKK